MTINVWLSELADAGRLWDQQAATLGDARRSLLSADTSLLGPGVAVAAEQFVDAWAERLGRLRDDADAHATALGLARTRFLVTDLDQVDSLRQLLAWSSRATDPGGGW